MNNKRLQQVSLQKEQLETIKGGYKSVPNGANAVSFIGSSVDIRLTSGKRGVFRNQSNGLDSINLSFALR